MPAYTTIAFQFPKAFRPGLVRRVYEAFGTAGLSFSGVFARGCDPNLSLEEVIEWNQRKLDENFELGLEDDCSSDYRQILLTGHPFSECRLFILNETGEVAFHCIVPQSEINESKAAGLRAAADRIWEALPVSRIDSHREWEDHDNLPPSAWLFAYTDIVTDEMQPARFVAQPLSRGYRLTRKQVDPGQDPQPSPKHDDMRRETAQSRPPTSKSFSGDIPSEN